MLYFTSDTHFGHKNVIKYSNRPFSNVKEMDEALINNWNKVVKPKDEIWFLGDFSFYPLETTNNILNALNGHIYWLLGNHDKWKKYDSFYSKLNSPPFSLKKIKYNHQDIILCHYPLLTWEKAHYGSWNLHGHCHGNLITNSNSRRIDVGVDCWNYTPVSFEQIKEVMDKKTYESVDHHNI